MRAEEIGRRSVVGNVQETWKSKDELEPEVVYCASLKNSTFTFRLSVCSDVTFIIETEYTLMVL